MQTHLQRIDNFLDSMIARPGLFDYYMYNEQNPDRKTIRKPTVTVQNLDRQEYKNILFNEILQSMRENAEVRDVIMILVSQYPDEFPPDVVPDARTILKFLSGTQLERQVYRNARRRFLLKNFNVFTQFEQQI